MIAADPDVVLGDGDGDQRADAVGAVQELSCCDWSVARDRDGSDGDGTARC